MLIVCFLLLLCGLVEYTLGYLKGSPDEARSNLVLLWLLFRYISGVNERNYDLRAIHTFWLV